MFNIGIVNQSKIVAAKDLNRWCNALRTQIGNDFSPIWGTYAVITNPPAPYIYQPKSWPLYLQDVADVPGALGYHDIDAKGVPFMKVFVKASLDNGVSVSSVMSHEILELLADPMVESSVLVSTPSGTGRIYATEICDPIEQESYLINGVEVSDFITPYWFMPKPPAGVQMDFLKRLSAPFTLTAGGYFSFMDVSGGGWQQVNGAKARLLKM